MDFVLLLVIICRNYLAFLALAPIIQTSGALRPCDRRLYIWMPDVMFTSLCGKGTRVDPERTQFALLPSKSMYMYIGFRTNAQGGGGGGGGGLQTEILKIWVYIYILVSEEILIGIQFQIHNPSVFKILDQPLRHTPPTLSSE